MDLTKVGIVSLIGIGGAGGGLVAYKYGASSKITKIREKLKGFPVTKEDDSIGSARITTLTSADSNTLHESLSKLKNPSFTKEGIRDGCISNLDSEFKEEDIKFKNIQSYCVYNNKDKLGSKAIREDESQKGTNANKVLESENGNLSSTMTNVKNKLKGTGVTQDTNALKEGCTKFYSEIGIGESNLDFKDAQSYCLEKQV